MDKKATGQKSEVLTATSKIEYTCELDGHKFESYKDLIRHVKLFFDRKWLKMAYLCIVGRHEMIVFPNAESLSVE